MKGQYMQRGLAYVFYITASRLMPLLLRVFCLLSLITHCYLLSNSLIERGKKNLLA